MFIDFSVKIKKILGKWQTTRIIELLFDKLQVAVILEIVTEFRNKKFRVNIIFLYYTIMLLRIQNEEVEFSKKSTNAWDLVKHSQ